jgi:predicted alpha-1,6-mannanase (GH76 family)
VNAPTRHAWIVLALGALHCGSDAPLEPEPPAPSPDAGLADAGARDGAIADASPEGASLTDASVADAAPPSTVWHARADRALQQMLLTYFTDGYLREKPGDPAPAGYWIYAQAFDALLDGVERSRGERYRGLVDTFYAGQEARGFTRDFYDDENWMALALLRAHALTHDPKYLAQARVLYTDIMAAWDTTCCGPKPGGLWWNRPHAQKATAINAGAVITGARLAERTGDASYLAFAKKTFDYWASVAIDPQTHQVTDHVSSAGVFVPWKFTYNEGLMIGAALELARATGDATYAATADAIAGFVVAHETVASSAGPVLSDGTNGSCGGDCAAFKGIAFRYLVALARARPATPSYRATLAGSAEAIWGLARDPNAALFAVDWMGPPLAAPGLQADASAAMALGVYADLVEPFTSDGTRAAGIYEAEEAALHGVGLEATHAGFGGWGYVAGWGSAGQRVDFAVDAPKAGHFDVELVYSAVGAGSRAVRVGAKLVEAKHPFADTVSWDTYASTTLAVDLAAGENVVSIAFDAGNTGWLNLDRIIVRAK